MLSVNIRKQGGAAIITIPSYILKTLNLKIGSALGLEVVEDTLVIRPAACSSRKRYTLEELLQGTDSKKSKQLNKETAWFRDAKSVGRELP